MLTRLSDNLLKLEHHAGFWKNWADELRKLATPTTNIALHLMLTKKSELTLTIKKYSYKLTQMYSNTREH